jgi:thymidylate synthase (FAD)
MHLAEIGYKNLRDNGCPPEQARAVLPNSLATTIVITANLREWRHILTLRTNKKAHPQMRQVANLILDILKAKLPIIFEDIEN